jgi:hypothetical protein
MVYNLCILIFNIGSRFLSIKLASTSIKLASTSISYQFNTPDQPIQNHKFNAMKFEMLAIIMALHEPQALV